MAWFKVHTAQGRLELVNQTAVRHVQDLQENDDPDPDPDGVRSRLVWASGKGGLEVRETPEQLAEQVS